MSNYLVHFTKTAEDLGAILTQGFIRADRPHGWGRDFREVSDAHRSACLSEIPLDQLDRLRARHGRYGIGFRRDFIKSAGGARVWYLDKDTPVAKHLFNRIGELLKQQNFDDAIWGLTPFIDPVIPGRNEWEWEREWRVPGGLGFTLADVAFAITPAGDRHAIEEEVGLEAPWIDPDDRSAFWAAVPTVLADTTEQLIAQFLQRFSDPIECLPTDGGSYVWIVTQYDTEDAVNLLFDDVQEEVRATIRDYLDSLSTLWVDTEELDDFLDSDNYGE